MQSEAEVSTSVPAVTVTGDLQQQEGKKQRKKAMMLKKAEAGGTEHVEQQQTSAQQTVEQISRDKWPPFPQFKQVWG